jgi:drug/metabolite transporter (DMT)-like permease
VPATENRSLKLQIVLAFLAVYVIWGSTYLAIRFVIQDFPPFMMAGVRFLIAGALLYALVRLRGAPTPKPLHWVPAGIIGTLLLVFGNLGVVLSERTVPTGLVSILVAMVPIYVAILDWLRPGGKAPTMRVIAGLALGALGIVFLVGPSNITGGHSVDMTGLLFLTVGSISWSAGTLYSRHVRWEVSPLMATAMQMLFAGGLLSMISLSIGEPTHFNITHVGSRAILSLVYLITFGSIVGFTAYIWLLNHVSPSRVATYAYVNPVVAVFLGWAMNGEKFTTEMMFAAAIILTAVWFITGGKVKNEPPRPELETKETAVGSKFKKPEPKAASKVA